MTSLIKLFPLGALLWLNFLAEDIHGILAHNAGTEHYSRLTAGALIRVPILAFLVLYALYTLRKRFSNRVVLALMVVWVWSASQALVMGMDIYEFAGTLRIGLRWLFLFLAASFVRSFVRRHAIPFDTSARLLKLSFTLCFGLPIFLAVLGIAGYATYDETSSRLGYVGFVLSQNAISSMFVFTLPLYLRSRTFLDYALLLLHVFAGLLIGAKLIYGGFAIVIAAWALSKAWSVRTWIRPSILVRIILVVGVIGAVLYFTPFLAIVRDIVHSLAHVFDVYMSGEMGRESTYIDVLSSHRTDRIRAFTAWALSIDHVPVLLFGGGVLSYQMLYGEVDWIDMIASFGVLGFLLFYGTILAILRNVLRHRTANSATMGGVILTSLAVSFTAGHTFIGPIDGIVLGYLIGAYLGQPQLRPVPATDPRLISTARPIACACEAT